MNKRGQSLIYGIMLMVFAFITVTIMLAPLKEVIEDGRGSSGLDCNNDSISTGIKATCLLYDMFLPYFVAAALFLGGGYLVNKKVKEYTV